MIPGRRERRQPLRLINTAMRGPRPSIWLIMIFMGGVSSAITTKAATPFCVCIDPGHPSETSDGSELTNGLREVSVNWEMGVLLRAELEHDGIVVVMSKKAEKELITNKDRATVANKAHADLLLRLHADSGAGSGFTVYYPSKSGTIQDTTGPTNEVLQSSALAANLFFPVFATKLRGSLKNNGLRGDEQTLVGARQGALTASIFSKVPTILVEMCFLTNTADAEWLKQAANKQLMCKALAAGVHAVRDKRATSPSSAGEIAPK
jgi:N-acetylmuramoyl-L-alanine amidase